MTQENFRRLIILQLLLGVASYVLYFSTIDYLPQPLQNYLVELYSAEMTINDWFFAAVGFLLLIVYIVTYAGIYKFKKWAKNLLLPIHIFALVMMPFTGISIETGLVSSINYLYCLVNAAILFLVYLPPVSQMFETKGNVRQATG